MKVIEYIKEIEPEMRWSGDELLIFLYSFWIEDFMKNLYKEAFEFAINNNIDTFTIYW